MKRESFLKIRPRTTIFKYFSQPPTSGQARHLPFQRSSEIFFVKMDNVEEEQPDTLPGFKMQSENFVLKFVTGLQKGVCRYSLEKNSKSQFSTFVFSKLLEYETDWYDMMEILLSRLEDEPVDQDKFQASRFFGFIWLV